MKPGIAITVAVLAGSLHAPGQDGFIVHYNALQAGRSGSGLSVRQIDDGYLVFCRQFSQQFANYLHVYARLLDNTGIVVDEHEFLVGDQRDFSFGSIDPVTVEQDGQMASSVSEGYDYSGTTSLYTFDLAGDTVSRKLLVGWPSTDSITHGLRQSRRTVDGGIVLGGFWQRSGDAQAYLIRLNSEGDTLWTKRIGLVTQDEDILGLAEYPDGGFVLTGYRAYGFSNNLSFLMRTDTNGNLIWTRYYGGTAGQNGAVRVTADGGIVTWSDYREPSWPFAYSQVMLTKWNADGDIVWQTKSHYGYYSGARDFEVLPDGSFIGVAFGAEIERGGMLCKFSSEGDSLWTRGYIVTNGPHYLNDITPTSDGGFVCTGEANRTMPIDAAFQQSQTIYVVKTDSVGCVVPGCHTVGVQEYVMDLNEHLRIAPNPVSNVLQAELDLPAGTTLHGHVRAVLLNAQGQEVRAWPMLRLEESLLLKEEIGALPGGAYYLHIVDAERWLAGGKVVVE